MNGQFTSDLNRSELLVTLDALIRTAVLAGVDVQDTEFEIRLDGHTRTVTISQKEHGTKSDCSDISYYYRSGTRDAAFQEFASESNTNAFYEALQDLLERACRSGIDFDDVLYVAGWNEEPGWLIELSNDPN